MSPPSRLYKVSPPREDMVFRPSPFWHTADWESSSTRPHAGYLREELLYAGDFDEVNIHLFPRVRTCRVRAVDADATALSQLGLASSRGKSAWVFLDRARRREVETFRPTVFSFRPDGFVWVRNGEYVSREPQRAIACETISMLEALTRWNVEPCYVNDLDDAIDRLKANGIYCDVQS